jgi:hypothetical protein
VTLQRKFFVLNQEEDETQEEDKSWGAATG